MKYIFKGIIEGLGIGIKLFFWLIVIIFILSIIF